MKGVAAVVERGTEFAYDVFISYAHEDDAWVWNWLVPRLKREGLQVCIDGECFEPGAPSLTEMERAVIQSRKTLLVLTPEYLSSEWSEFENILAQTLDPAARRRRVIPLLLKQCDLPPRIGMLTYADFTRQEEWEAQLERVVAAIRGELQLPEVGPPLDQLQGAEEPSSIVSSVHDTAVVRALLTAAFDDEELTTLCYDDFGPVYEEFSAGMSKRQKIQRLLDYCERHIQTEKLLELVQKHNPAQYARFKDRLSSQQREGD